MEKNIEKERKRIVIFNLLVITIISLTIFISGCKPAERKFCDNEARPMACYDLYVPVCGSDGKEYGNWCYACMNPEVEWYVKGKCS